MASFIKDLRKGQKKEHEIAEFLKMEYEAFSKDVDVKVGASNKKNSAHDIEIRYTYNDERFLKTFEVKADFMYEKTKNIAFEDCTKSKDGKMTYSGLYTTTADFWVVWTIIGVAIFRTKDLIDDLYLRRMSGDKKIIGRFCGDGWRAHNLIVNFAYALTFESLDKFYPTDVYNEYFNKEKEPTNELNEFNTQFPTDMFADTIIPQIQKDTALPE